MSAERALSPAAGPAARRVTRVAALAGLALVYACGGSDTFLIASETAPDGRHVALVRVSRCDGDWCHSLWVGTGPGTATRLATLPSGAERCDEIAWSRDGRRVAFLINGHQLRLYDPERGAPAGLLDLVPADAIPTTRIARGITFSDTGAAITFVDCPRDRSGCKPGFAGLR